MTGIVNGEKLLPEYQLISFCYGLSPRALSALLCLKSSLLPCGRPEMEPLKE